MKQSTVRKLEAVGTAQHFMNVLEEDDLVVSRKGNVLVTVSENGFGVLRKFNHLVLKKGFKAMRQGGFKTSEQRWLAWRVFEKVEGGER